MDSNSLDGVSASAPWAHAGPTVAMSHPETMISESATRLDLIGSSIRER